MTEQKFKSEMRRAQAMTSLESNPMMSEYWSGYQRGLRRAYHGSDFGTEEEHEAWSKAIKSTDPSRKQRGRGYRDGLMFDEIASKRGRQSKGDALLANLIVPSELKVALEEKAEKLGISLPDARRMAYEQWIGE